MTVVDSEYVVESRAVQESVYFVCWLMGPEVFPGLPEVAPVQLSPFVPVTEHEETFEMFQ